MYICEGHISLLYNVNVTLKHHSTSSYSAQNETQPSDWLVGNTTEMTTNGSRPVFDKDEKDSDNIENLQNTSLFFVSGCQYLTVALVFNRGPPFRQPLYTNCELHTTVALPLNIIHTFSQFPPVVFIAM